MDTTEPINTDPKDDGQGVFVGIALALMGIGCVIFAIFGAVRGPGGYVSVSAVVTDVESAFEWNPARQTRELVTRPTVRFADPLSGQEHRVRLNETAPAGVSVGSTLQVSIMPGAPRSARLGGGSFDVNTAVSLVVGLGLIGLGISTARPSSVSEE